MGAYGAAVQGGILSGAGDELNDVVLLDVCPLSMGIETVGGVMTKIITRNTVVPTKKQQIFSTASDNPQIEVTFEIDVNGILRVSAEEKGSNNKESITIKNDDNRLSPEDIERMIKEAEERKEEDEAAKARVDAKNELEGLAYSMKNQVNDKEKLGGKLSEEDKEAITTACDDAISWLDSNQDADAEALQEKKKELEEVIHPITSKAAGGEGGQGHAEDEL